MKCCNVIEEKGKITYLLIYSMKKAEACNDDHTLLPKQILLEKIRVRSMSTKQGGKETKNASDYNKK